MANLLFESLTFLSEQATLYKEHPQQALESIRERAHQLRMYARDGCPEDLGHIENEKEPSEQSNIVTDEGQIKSNPKILSFEDNRITLPPIPNLRGVDNDSLRNLLMSWFYAGYYTAKAELVSQQGT